VPLPKKGMIVGRRILENIMAENSNFILRTPPIYRSIDPRRSASIRQDKYKNSTPRHTTVTC